MDILKRLGDYLDTRRAHDQPEVTLDSIVKRGEGHIRKQRWLSAAGGAAGMLVFVVVGPLAFNSTDPISTEPDSPASEQTIANATTATRTVTTPAPTRDSSEEAFSRSGLSVTDSTVLFGGGGFDLGEVLPAQLSTDSVAVSWQTTSGGLSWTQHMFESDGRFYALSTAPGVTYDDYNGQGLAQAIYVSSDGLEWDANLIDDGFFASGFGIRDDALYVLGTSPASAALRAGKIGRSTDGGATWAYTDLPLITEAPTEFGRTQGSNTAAQLAVGDVGVLAVFNTMYYVDYWGAIPIEYHDRTKERWLEATDEGIILRDFSGRQDAELACEEAMAAEGYPEYASEEDFPAECTGLRNGEDQGDIVYSVTWEELGLTNGNPTGTSELFYSADGIDFERIDSPFGVMSRFSAFEAIDGGFLVVEQDNQTGASTVWTSTDGRAWTQLPGGPAISWITAVGAMPNGLAIVGDAYTGDRNLTVLSTTTDRGVTWTSIAVPRQEGSVEQYTSGAAVGEFGAIVATSIWTYNPEAEYEEGSLQTILYLTRDYQTWSVIDLGDVIDAEQYEITNMAAAGDRIRFDVFEWSLNDGSVTRQSYVGTLGG